MFPLSENLRAALNEQMNVERYNAAVYAALANQFESLNLTGCATWARKAGAEELDHYQRFSGYLIDRNARVELTALDAPQIAAADVVSMFTAAAELEADTTQNIVALHDISDQVGDFGACTFLQWFIREQEESERALVEILGRLQLFGSSGAGLAAIDHELGGD